MVVNGMLVVASDGDEASMMIVSVKDDIWFVPSPSFPPDMDTLKQQIEKNGTMVVLGAICGKGDA